MGSSPSSEGSTRRAVVRAAAQDLGSALTTSEEPTGPLSPIAEELHRLRRELYQREAELASQPPIEQAKGMLMQDFALTPQEASDVLARLAQESSTAMSQVAEQLVGLLTGSVSTETAAASRALIEELRRRLGRCR